MEEDFSPAGRRLLRDARMRAARTGRSFVVATDLFASLRSIEHAESGRLFGQTGIPRFESLPINPRDAGEPQWGLIELDPHVRAVLRRASEIAIEYSRFEAPGSEEILVALLENPGPVADEFDTLGVDRESLIAKFHQERTPAPIPTDRELEWRADGPPELTDIGRILDANLNRAREGIRVAEEFARFVVDHPAMSASFKNARHQLFEIRQLLPAAELALSRDTESDVGTTLSNRSEESRATVDAVAETNLVRAQEALRVIEEYAKLESIEPSRKAKSLRYELYTLQTRLHRAKRSHDLLSHAHLYWLCDPESLTREMEWTLREAVQGGVGIVQLRDKRSSDRAILERGRQLREWTRELGVLFVMNDRPDLARLCQADGVHVGQDELTVRDVRRIVGPNMLIGVSTHSAEEARKALRDGADYLGVGPVFASKTKSFASLVGVDLVREVASAVELPTFAIGGIDTTNVSAIRQAGGRRIAVSHAISSADDPAAVARMLLDRLTTP